MVAMMPSLISISIVSHGQIGLVTLLLADIQKYCDPASLEVLLTVNIPESLPPTLDCYPFMIKLIHNPSPLGFGANHNRALSQAQGAFFAVINPDVRIASDIFPLLVASLETPSAGVVAPLVLDPAGAVEDSARRFPTPLKILCKLFGRCKGGDYVVGAQTLYPDWVGGMFMLFRRDVYRQMGGFNEKFFLYYEDVDLCARIWLEGLSVALIPQARVTHEARRSSHRSATYLALHLRSMARFFLSLTFVKALLLRRLR